MARIATGSFIDKNWTWLGASLEELFHKKLKEVGMDLSEINDIEAIEVESRMRPGSCKTDRLLNGTWPEVELTCTPRPARTEWTNICAPMTGQIGRKLIKNKQDLWVHPLNMQWMECFTGYWGLDDREFKVIDGQRYERYIYKGYTRDGSPMQDFENQMGWRIKPYDG